MSTIKIVSKKYESNPDLGVRAIEVDAPAILQAENLEELVAIQGEDDIFKKAMAQILIQFRSHVRTKMDATTEEDAEFANSDEDLLALDFSEWKPETKTRKSAYEKAMEIMGQLPPEEREKALATLAELQSDDEE